MVTELLHADSSVTLDEAIDLAFNTQVSGADKWQERVAKAWQSAGDAARRPTPRRCSPTFRIGIGARTPGARGRCRIMPSRMAVGGKLSEAVAVPADLSDQDIVAAIGKATDWLRSKAGSVNARYGDVFRVAQEGWQGELAYRRRQRERKPAWRRRGRFRSATSAIKSIGHGGQTSTQIVVLSKPPRSYMVLPLGESDRPE